MSSLYLERAEIDNVTEAGIRKIIKACSTVQKYQKLQQYYEGDNDILRSHKRYRTVPNNKTVNNMAKFVTDTKVGYFLGKPVIYSSADDAFMKRVKDIFEYNDEQDHNMELAKAASIKGRVYEMFYVDEDGRLRFAKVAPDDLVLIKESEFKQPLGAIRTVYSVDLAGNSIMKVEFWTWTQVYHFRSRNGGALNLERVVDHMWEDVPFVEYINNEECMGDFEGIITQIDAYNRVQSNTANVFQYNDEALLTVEGLGDVSSDDIALMKEKGAIILEVGGKIGWLIKDIDDAALENFKNRLFQDMHIFSGVPNMADENFGNNLSGVAMDYKLWNLEQICAIAERKFKKGLQRRIELIARYLDLLGHKFDYRDIDMQFRRNKPQNLLELAEIFVQLAGGVSLETRLAMLPLIENVQDEITKLKAERKDELDEFGASQYDNLLAQLEALKHQDSPDETPPDSEVGA